MDVPWIAGIIRAVDLDGGAPDELLVLSPGLGFEAPDASAGGTLMIAHVEGDALVPGSSQPLGLWALGDVSPQLEIADLDGDGDGDIMYLGYDTDGDRHLFVFMNEGTGNIDVGVRLDLVLPKELGTTRGVAAVELDGDAGLELVVLTDVGAYRVELSEGSLTTPERFDSLVAGDALAAGDVDGDGVGDIVIAGQGRVQLFPGTPVHP
jgi:hypothetical protein